MRPPVVLLAGFVLPGCAFGPQYCPPPQADRMIYPRDEQAAGLGAGIAAVLLGVALLTETRCVD